LHQRVAEPPSSFGRLPLVLHNLCPAASVRRFTGGVVVRIHSPKHPTTAFWHAALLAGVVIALWLLVIKLSPEPAHRAVTTEATMPIRVGTLHPVSPEPANA
jgi:hypothetical protein